MATDLITLAEYKAYASILSTTQDTVLKSLIPKVSALVKTICRRTFVDYVSDTKTDIFRGGFDTFILSESPILAVSSVEFSEDYGVTYTELTEFIDYVYDPEGYVELINDTYIGYNRPNAFKITYNAGYEEVPVELKLAVLDLVKYYLQNDAAVHSNKSPGTNSVQIEYITSTSLPAHIKRVLDLHTASY